MSTSYDIYCLTCPYRPSLSLGWDGDHRADELMELLALRDGIEALALAVARKPPVWLEIGLRVWSRTTTDISYFAEHKGHRLRVISEYGDPADLCCEYPPASKTVGRMWCSRPLRHTGDHRFDGDVTAPEVET